MNDDKHPTRLYAAVLIALVAEVILFHLFTRMLA
jgi:hypothetical protein